MTFVVDAQWLAALVLASLRLAALLVLAPIFVLTQLPLQVRVLFVVALALVLLPAAQPALASVPLELGAFVQVAVYELLTGAAMAFGLFAAFGAILFGGRLLDFQMGFAVANLIDPATAEQTPLLGTALHLAAVLTFYLIDGHHALMHGIAYSFQLVPLAAAPELQLAVIVAHFGTMFVLGLAVVMPAVLVLLLLDVVIAVAARTMPQVNMFIFSLPIKVFVGLTMVALSLNYLAPLFGQLYLSVFRYWQQVLGS